VKLEERLRHPLDELDTMIAEVMFDKKGNIDLKKATTVHDKKASSTPEIEE